MTGLENIIKGIEDEAKLLADDILKKAKREADEITSKAKQVAMDEVLSISDKSKKQIKFMEEKNKSFSEMKGKQIILQSKNDIINSVIKNAESEILNMNDDDYFNFILKLVNKFLSSKSAMIIFSNKDLNRMTYDFRNELIALAENKGSQLTISSSGADISGGFIISYGEIEENCSLDALFESFHADISDKISQVLFAS